MSWRPANSKRCTKKDFVVQQVVLSRIIDCVDTLCADKIYDCQFNIETEAFPVIQPVFLLVW